MKPRRDGSKMDIVYAFLVVDLLLLFVIAFMGAATLDKSKQISNRVLFEARRMTDLSIELGRIRMELDEMKYKAQKKENKHEK